MTHQERLTLALEIVDRARAIHGDDLLAAGLYGSMARGTDGPYSDIEMYCILRSPGHDYSHEWSYGPGKVEVDFYSADLLLAKAAEVDGRWSLTRGSVAVVKPLYDPDGYFAQLLQAFQSPRPERFQAAIEETLTGELYEYAGKLRNARAAGHAAYLPTLAVEMVRYGAYVVGTHHRHLYTTGARVLEEALTLPDRPDGFDQLAALAMAGSLSAPAAVHDACERFWAGLCAWAERHGYRLQSAGRIPF